VQISSKGFCKRYSSHGIPWDNMGWDGTKILRNHPIPWDEKFLESIPSHDGTEILRSAPFDGTKFFLEVSHPMMG
jgi:hypothetical protein